MPSASRPVFLRGFGRALSSRRRRLEPADMGTAFALDYSLDQAPLVDPLLKTDGARVPLWRRWFARRPRG